MQQNNAPVSERTYDYTLMDDSVLTGEHNTWLDLFEAIVEARGEKSPYDVPTEIWNGFLTFVFVLIPNVQSW